VFYFPAKRWNKLKVPLDQDGEGKYNNVSSLLCGRATYIKCRVRWFISLFAFFLSSKEEWEIYCMTSPHSSRCGNDYSPLSSSSISPVCVCVCVCLLMCAVTLPGADTRMIHRRPTRKSWIFFFSVFITQSPAWKDKYLPPFSYFNFFPCVIIFYFKLPRYHYGDGSLLHSAQNISWEIIKFCFFFSFFKNGAGGRK
jgi:hypothetical protein